MMKFEIAQETLLSELINDCMTVLEKDLTVIEEDDIDPRLGFVWCVPDRQSIHFVNTTIGDWCKFETKDRNAQPYYDYRQIVDLAKDPCCTTPIQEDDEIVFAILSVLHEIGHCVDYQNDKEDFEYRADRKQVELGIISSYAQAQADEGKDCAEVFSRYAALYRCLPCEKEADRYAVSNLEKMLLQPED